MIRIATHQEKEIAYHNALRRAIETGSVPEQTLNGMAVSLGLPANHWRAIIREGAAQLQGERLRQELPGLEQAAADAQAAYQRFVDVHWTPACDQRDQAIRTLAQLEPEGRRLQAAAEQAKSKLAGARQHLDHDLPREREIARRQQMLAG